MPIKCLNTANYLSQDAIIFAVMDISKNIKAIREAKRLTQADIAERIGVDGSNYAKQEKRGSKLTVEQIEKIAGALGVSVVELLTGEPQKVEDSEKVKELEKRVEELEQSLKEVRELKEYQQKSIDSKNIALKLVNETIDIFYASLQQSVLEEPEMPIELAKIGYSELDYLIKIVTIIVDAGDLATMEDSLRNIVNENPDGYVTFLSIFDKRNKKGGLAYWNGKYVVSEEKMSRVTSPFHNNDQK